MNTEKDKIINEAVEKLHNNPLKFVPYRRPSQFNRLRNYNSKIIKKEKGSNSIVSLQENIMNPKNGVIPHALSKSWKKKLKQLSNKKIRQKINKELRGH